MDYPQTRTASPDERLMAAIRIIVSKRGENDGPAAIEQAVDTFLTLRQSSRKRRQ